MMTAGAYNYRTMRINSATIGSWKKLPDHPDHILNNLV
ncbi:hypothetical protein IMCC9480_68 [Oxalobacteraceae bacterium IMCC9480]|nr:hypothetical protein IMCC9480_68 [Oxalobacteraceae bacterium IMCC9480]